MFNDESSNYNPYYEVEFENMEAILHQEEAENVMPIDEVMEAKSDFMRKLSNYNEIIGGNNAN